MALDAPKSPDAPIERPKWDSKLVASNPEAQNWVIKEIQTQEKLASKIEDNSNSYGLDNFYKLLPEKVRIAFIANLTKAGINPDNFDIMGARCTTFQVKDSNGEIQGFSIQSIHSGDKAVHFPMSAALQSCWGKENVPSLDEYVKKFNAENNFPNTPLEPEAMRKLESDILQMPAKEFLEKGDGKAFNLAFEQFGNLSNQSKQAILDKIKALYTEGYPYLGKASLADLGVKVGKGERLFMVGKEMGYSFGE